METPSKPTSTTKLEEIFATWDEFSDSFDHFTGVEVRNYYRRENARAELNRLGVVWGKRQAIVNGCILLVR